MTKNPFTMSKTDKIKWIRKSSHGRSIVGHAQINFYSNRELDEIIQQIGQKLIAESELIAQAYINGHR